MLLGFLVADPNIGAAADAGEGEGALRLRFAAGDERGSADG